MININHLTQPIPATQLQKSPLNVRRIVSRTGLDELKASILSHGLMQNLVVTRTGSGQYHVIAGGRRLEAIHSLQHEDKLSKDFEAACQIVSEESAKEMSLAENIVRQAMHPADQFDAFASLVEQGQTIAEIAIRFGVEQSLVHRRLKLAKVAPELIQLYRDDQITMECLMAFTVTDDHNTQLAAYESLLPWQMEDPFSIREALTEQLIKASSKLAQFVGLETYIAAGGPVRSDLFDDETYLENPTLLNQLATQKLETIRQELLAEGWSWIELQLDRDFSFIHRCTRIRPQLTGAPPELLESKSQLDSDLDEIKQLLNESESDEMFERKQEIQCKLDDVETELAAFFGFDTDEMKFAGCYVSVGFDGEVFLDKGLVKPEHRKHLGGQTVADGTPAARVTTQNPLTASLCRELASARLQVAQLQLVKHPEIALDLLRYQVVSSMLNHPPIRVNALEVEFRRPKPDATSNSSLTLAYSELTMLAESFPVKWMEAETDAERFEAFCLLSNESKSEMFAYCIAMTLRPKLAPISFDDVTAYDIALALTAGNVADYWRPDSVNFFSRINRQQLLAVGREVLGEAWAHSRVSDKKSTLVLELHRAFAEPNRSGRTNEQVQLLKQWVPTCMAFDIQTTEESSNVSLAA